MLLIQLIISITINIITYSAVQTSAQGGASFPVSGEANPNVLHGNIRVKNQALPMHQANQVHLEPADVGHVDAAQKRSSVLDCVLQHIRLL